MIQVEKETVITIPRLHAVLTDEEYSDSLMTKNDNEMLRDKNEKLLADVKRMYKNIGKYQKLVQTSTAKAILEEVSRHCGGEWLVDLEKKFIIKEI